VLSERFGPAVARHPLKREIIATYITNTVVNRTGATFVNFIAAEAGATAADVVRAFTLAREIFALESLWDRIDTLDGQVPAPLQLDLLGRLISMAQRASRWMLRARTDQGDLPSLITATSPQRGPCTTIWATGCRPPRWPNGRRAPTRWCRPVSTRRWPRR
jgi:glutamate dehydrogenase